MNLIVETGEGVSGANAYAGLSYALRYLTERNKTAEWNAVSRQSQEAALIEATTYIDIRFGTSFLGARKFTDLPFFARGYITLRVNPVENDFVNIGNEIFTFKESVTNDFEVQIGLNTTATLFNLASEINDHSTFVEAKLNDTGSVLTITALESGEVGNQIVTQASNRNSVVLDTPTLSGGREPGSQPLEFPRIRLYDRRGVLVEGIPEKLKQATVEYASRAVTAALMPDPQYDQSGGVLSKTFVRVGPIEDEKVFLPNAFVITRKYPMADRLLMEYTGGTGGVSR